MRMRILHVTDAYSPKLGGIETQVRDLASRQVAMGHQVEVLTCTRAGRGVRRQPPPASEGGTSDVVVHRTALPWRNLPGSNTATYRLLRERRPEVVHAHLSVLSPQAILAVRACARTGVPVVATVHSLWWWAQSLYRTADLLIRWGSWPVRWTAVSDLATQPLRRIIRNRTEVRVLPNGIDQGAWRIERTDDQITADDEFLVVSVMRLALRKRPRALLNIVRAVRDHLPADRPLRVVVIGDGPQRRAMTRRLRRLDLTGVVELVGRKEADQIHDLYRRADVYLAPAILESFGIAALEARCAGVPIVARHHTGIADFVAHRVNGLLADTDQGLADAILELANSPGLRAEIMRNNAEPVPGVGWSEVLASCELAYRQARDVAGDQAVDQVTD